MKSPAHKSSGAEFPGGGTAPSSKKCPASFSSRYGLDTENVIFLLQTVCAGLFFYWLCGRFRLIYGICEIGGALVIIGLTFYPQPHYLAVSLLRLQLRFIRSNERANVSRHVQQLQPLFFI